jgi:hypothetical protein
LKDGNSRTAFLSRSQGRSGGGKNLSSNRCICPADLVVGEQGEPIISDAVESTDFQAVETSRQDKMGSLTWSVSRALSGEAPSKRARVTDLGARGLRHQAMRKQIPSSLTETRMGRARMVISKLRSSWGASGVFSGLLRARVVFVSCLLNWYRRRKLHFLSFFEALPGQVGMLQLPSAEQLP